MLCRPTFCVRVQRLDHRFRIPSGHTEQGQGRAIGRPPPLFPIPERGDAHADHQREFRLGGVEFRPHGLHIRRMEGRGPGRSSGAPTNLTGLPNAREQFLKRRVLHRAI